MSHHKPTGTHCQNCGTELKGSFCHHCGQHDFDAGQSFGHAVHELLESFFHWDGKFFRGTYDLLFRPGRLTREYNAGKRASHMPPLRLYIFVSLLFFLAPTAHEPSDSDALKVVPAKTPPAASVANTKSSSSHKGPIAASPKSKSAQTVSSDDGDILANKIENAITGAIDNVGKPKGAEDESGVKITLGDTELERALEEKTRHPEKIIENFHHYLPRAVLVCVPFFALLSMGIFRKSGYSFLQHLVLSLHLHSFFFLFTLAAGGWIMLAELISPVLANVLYVGRALYIVIFAYLCLRHVFGNMRKRGTIARGLLLLSSYGMLLLLALALTGCAAVWLS